MIRIISVILTFFGGLYFFLEFLLPEELSYGAGEIFKFGKYFPEVGLGVSLVSNIAVGLGVVNIFLVHGKILLSWKKGAIFSMSLLVFFMLTLVLQAKVWTDAESMSMSWRSYDAVLFYVKQIKGEPKEEEALKIKSNLGLLLEDEKFFPLYISREEFKDTISPYLASSLTSNTLSGLISDLSVFKAKSLKSIELILKETASSKLESLVLKGLFFPLGGAMFSLLAFYIGYAAYRTFRVQSKEAMVMMIAALLIILGQIPQGVTYISSDLPELRFWLLEYLSTPAFRAIYFGSAIAGLGLAVRMWFSMEKNPF